MIAEELFNLMKEREREFRGGNDCVGSNCASLAAASRELTAPRSRRRGRRSTLWHRRRLNRGDFEEEATES